MQFLIIKKKHFEVKLILNRGRSRGRRGGRTSPLSEFKTLVMGIFVPAHTPHPNPPPQDLFLLGSYICLK